MLSTLVSCAVCREELLEPVSQEDLQEMQQALLAAFQAVTGEPPAALCWTQIYLHKKVVTGEPAAALCQVRKLHKKAVTAQSH